MKVDSQHPIFSKIELRDSQGKRVPWVQSYDVKNQVAVLYIGTTVSKKGLQSVIVSTSRTGVTKALTVEVRIKGSYLVFRETGLRVTLKDLKDSKK